MSESRRGARQPDTGSTKLNSAPPPAIFYFETAAVLFCDRFRDGEAKSGASPVTRSGKWVKDALKVALG